MVLNNVRVGPRAPRLASRRSLRRMIQATGPRVISPCPGLRTHLNSSAGRAGKESAIRNTHPAASTARNRQQTLVKTKHQQPHTTSISMYLTPSILSLNTVFGFSVAARSFRCNQSQLHLESCKRLRCVVDLTP